MKREWLKRRRWEKGTSCTHKGTGLGPQETGLKGGNGGVVKKGKDSERQISGRGHISGRA